MIEISLSSIYLLVLTCLLVGILHWFSVVYRSGLPPGPTPLPIVGNVHQLAMQGSDKFLETLNKWAAKYGEVYTLYFGSSRAFVLNSYDCMKEALSLPVLSGRPHSFISDKISQNLGLINIEGLAWKEQRRFALSHLRDFGFGKTSFEDHILEETRIMLDYMETTKEQPTDLQFVITHSIANNITSILWGKRYDYGDQLFHGFLESINENVKAIGQATTFDLVVPFLKYLPGDVLGLKAALVRVELVERYLRSLIEEHKESLNPDNVRDFLDVYLLQLNELKTDEGTHFSEEQLVKSLGDLFVAGLETTSTTLRWILLYLVIHPDIQEKARAEIDDAIGYRDPSVRDRPNLPYTEAVIMEAHRVGMIASTGVPHAALEDTTFRGYSVPKGTAFIPNMASIFMNENEFPEPDKFDPTRYLDNEGKVNKAACEKVIPFSIGRRVCLGESLARMELTLYLTTMLQRFVFTLPDSSPVPSVRGRQGFTRMPHPYKVCIKRRPDYRTSTDNTSVAR